MAHYRRAQAPRPSQQEFAPPGLHPDFSFSARQEFSQILFRPLLTFHQRIIRSNAFTTSKTLEITLRFAVRSQCLRRPANASRLTKIQMSEIFRSRLKPSAQ